MNGIGMPMKLVRFCSRFKDSIKNGIPQNYPSDIRSELINSRDYYRAPCSP